MRPDIPAIPDPTLLLRDNIAVRLYDVGVGPGDLIAGDPGAYRDISELVAGCRQTDTGSTLTLRYLAELSGPGRPVLGQVVSIRAGAYAIFNGIIDSVSGERENRATATRELTVEVRRRDSVAWWREVRRISETLPAGADLGGFARTVARALGLTDAEIDIPDIGVIQAHDQSQLVDLNAWDMLEQALAPGLREPLVDGRGVLKTANRNLQGRLPDLEVTDAVLVDLARSTARSPCTIYRVKYLDSQIQPVRKPDQRLAGASGTAGFFRKDSHVQVWFSEDRRQRAESTYLLTHLSVNDGLFGRLGNETWSQNSEFGGEIHVFMSGAWYYTNLLALLAAIAAAGAVDWVPVIGGLSRNAAIALAIAYVGHIGHGVYDVMGVPVDYVNTVNEVEAYDESAPVWETKLEEVQNDLIPNDQVATSLAVNELLYRSRENQKAGLVLADDLRIERGDVIGLPDGRRFFTTGYQRELTRGAAAELSLEGFWI